MEIIKYLNASTEQSMEDVLVKLEEDLGIKSSSNPDYPELVVLNYSQINSPKTHPIVMECRSLVLEFKELGNWLVVSRSFDRFLNYGETETGYNVTELTGYDKIDGSLIGLFYHDKYGWLYRTKSMIMPECRINDLYVTWDDVIEDALRNDVLDYINDKPGSTHTWLDMSCTYILELTSVYNRIVTKYESTSMYLLAVRNNDSGKYCAAYYCDAAAHYWGWNRPSAYTFSTMSECADSAAALPDLQEGYVMYDSHGEPACKMKNPAYVAAHHLRGEDGITPKRVINLIEDNELDEYLSTFPEDAALMAPYIRAYNDIISEANSLWMLYRTLGTKERALAMRGNAICHLVFPKMKGIGFEESFSKLHINSKKQLVNKYIKVEL